MYSGVCEKEDGIKAGAEKFICKIKQLNENMQIPKTLEGIKTEDIRSLAKHADREGNPLYPVPVLMGAKELEKFYYEVSDWR